MVGSKQVATCRSVLSRSTKRTRHLISATLVVLGICAAAGTAAQQPPATEPEEEYGEFLARPGELGSFAVNDIFKSLRLTAGAMSLGKKVYEKNCAACHGADLKGIPDQHTPDLTDAEWRFSGDDLVSGGNVKFPSDVEWTVRYGIRSEHPNARGLEADMLAYDPKHRTEEDTKELAGTNAQCWMNGSPFMSSIQNTMAFSAMMPPVTTGMRTGRRETSPRGIMVGNLRYFEDLRRTEAVADQGCHRWCLDRAIPLAIEGRCSSPHSHAREDAWDPLASFPKRHEPRP